jgi:SAM-dependent methyltransferase
MVESPASGHPRDVASDLHDTFPDPGCADAREVADFLLAVDRLPGVRRVRHAMSACLPAPRAGRTVVDLGCGPGWETERLAASRPGERVIGVDHNPALVAAARARVPGGHPEWRCAELSHTGLPAGSVDVVRTERVLMYVADLGVAVEQIVALLRPAGQVVSFELDYGGTLLSPGRASDDTVRRVAAHLERSLPQPWAGRRLPGMFHERGLSVTAEPHAVAVDRTVWRWIVRDTVLRAVADARLDPAGVDEWLIELDVPDFPGFRTAFTGVLTTARRR